MVQYLLMLKTQDREADECTADGDMQSAMQCRSLTVFFRLLWFTARSTKTFTLIFISQETAEAEGVHGKEDGDGVRYSAASLTGAGFQLERHINVAVKMLSLDPNLAKIHARLISRIPEKTFWHHYFSRVAALRTEVGLEPLCEDLLQVRILGLRRLPHGI